MKFDRSSNPVLSDKLFFGNAKAGVYTEKMTLQGTINKTFILFLLMLLSGGLTWKMAFAGSTGLMGWMIFGLIGGIVFALITTFKAEWSMYTAPAYALCEGLALGAISAMYSQYMSGIVVRAILLTLSILFVMLFIYKTGIIQVNQKFVMGMTAALGGVALFYISTMILSMFGVNVSLFRGGWIGILITLAIIVIASLSLILDFYTIEQGVNYGAPKYMEWYGGFSIMLTLVWLYIEILRLLSLLSGRD